MFGNAVDVVEKNMAIARQHLQAAFEAVKAAADSKPSRDEKLEQLYMHIGALHNDVANYGK